MPWHHTLHHRLICCFYYSLSEPIALHRMSGHSSSVLSDDSMDKELSFSASASRSSKSPVKGPAAKAPVKQLAPWPKSTSPARPKAVSFDRHSDSELSFTVEDQSTSHGASPLHLVEQQHVVDLERLQRHRCRDEEASTWQHILRLSASNKMNVEGAQLKREAEHLKAQPLSASAADVAPIMKKYLEHLKEAPSTTEITALRQTREELERKAANEKQRTDALNAEVATIKSYTMDVIKTIEAQEHANVEATHQRQQQAKEKHDTKVGELASSIRLSMAQGEKERLDKLRVRQAYVKLHGNYETQVDQGESLRLERLAAARPKVQSRHEQESVNAAQELKNKIRDNAERRRAEAAALAERQAALLQERIEAQKEILQSHSVLMSELDTVDRQAQAEACRVFKAGSEELKLVKLDRERSTFLNRMVCNADVNEEVEQLRVKRFEERQALWKEKQDVMVDRQRVAENASAAGKQNKAKLRHIDRLMADEAILVNEANSRLHNRNLAERRRDERALLLEAEHLTKRKALDELYSKRAPLSPIGRPLPTSPAPTHAALHPAELQCAAVVESERACQAKYLQRHFPKKTRVLPLEGKSDKSLAFASLDSLKAVKTSNPRLAELASRLAQLESVADPPVRHTSTEERAETRKRLTQRTAAQDARRQIHEGLEPPATIHDGVAKQHGVNHRLYQPPSPRQTSHTHNEPRHFSEQDEEAVKAFVTRFYTEPIRKQEQALASAHSRAKAHVSTTPTLRMTDKELANVQDRLYYTGTGHLSPGLERRLDAKQQDRDNAAQHRISDDDAIERFYTTPKRIERESLQKLDEQYLKR